MWQSKRAVNIFGAKNRFSPVDSCQSSCIRLHRGTLSWKGPNPEKTDAAEDVADGGLRHAANAGRKSGDMFVSLQGFVLFRGSPF